MKFLDTKGNRYTKYCSIILSLRFRASQFYITIIQQDAAVRSQSSNSATLEEGSCTDVWPVTEAVDTVNVLLMIGVESTRNM